jgi:hypothetical protein
MLGAYLEQSLQLVNPRLALHYMEYTKYFSSDDFQKHMLNPMDGGAWLEFLSSKWFGSNDPYTGQIIDGRWAGQTVPYVNEEFLTKEGIPLEKTFFPAEEESWLQVENAHIASPYGLLRSPWNFNPSNFTTRYNNVNQLYPQNVSDDAYVTYRGSTCDNYEVFIKNKVIGQTLETYITFAEYTVHGPIHFAFGGAGGAKAVEIDSILRSNYGFTTQDLIIVSDSSQKFFKSNYPNMVSNGIIHDNNPMTFLNCTTTYYQDHEDLSILPGEEGGPYCGCNSVYFENEDNLNLLIDEFFNFKGETDAYVSTFNFVAGFAYDDRLAVRSVIRYYR